MKCQAITKSTKRQCQREAINGTQYCWQHQAQEQKIELKTQRTDIVKTIPKDIFTNLGGYLSYKDLGLARRSNFPKEINIQKYCLTLELTDLQTIKNIIKNYPKLKNFILKDDNMVIDDTFLIQLFESLKTIKNLEALTFRSDYYDERLKINWLGFRSLRYIRIDHILYSDIDIYNLVVSIPTLESLKMDNEYFVETKTEKIIPETLKYLHLVNIHYTDITDYPNLLNYRFLKALSINTVELIELSNMSLDFLSIRSNDDYRILNSQNIEYFPTQLRFLYIEFIGYEISIFNKLKLPFLEYLGMSNLGSLVHIIDSLFTYPKLQHLYIEEIKFHRLNEEFLKKLKTLKKKIPKLTLDFDTTKTNEIILSTDFSDEEEVYVLNAITDRESIAREKYWNEFRSIFNLSEMVESDGQETLEFHQYTITQWLTDNGYYVNIDCAE